MSELIAGLTGTELAVLLVLAATVEPVRNPDLKRLGPALEAPSRRKLQRLGLLEVETGERRALVLSLTDKGWATAEQLLHSPPPDRATPQLRALLSFAAGIGRYLRRESLALGEVMVPETTVQQTLSTTDQVMQAYRKIASKPGAWVSLAALRAALTDLTREQVDAALRELYPLPEVHIVAEDNLKALTPDDHAAALHLGGRRLNAIRVTR